MIAARANAKLTFVLVRTSDGVERAHLTNIHEIRLSEIEHVATQSSIDLSPEESRLYEEMVNAAKRMIPADEWPEDAVESLMNKIYVAGVHAGRAMRVPA